MARISKAAGLTAAILALLSVAAACGGSGSGLFAINPEDGSARKVAGGCIETFAWSPDGRRIAYSTSGGELSAVEFVDGEVRERRRLADSAAGPSWSPDGSKVGFVAMLRIVHGQQVSTDGALIVVDFDSGSAKRIDTGVGAWPPAAWSPDGRLIAFHADPGLSIWVTTPEGKSRRSVTEGGVSAPAWFPDGRRIIYSGHDSDAATNVLKIVATDGTGLRRLGTADEFGFYVPPVSPDGSRLAYATRDAIFLVNADGSGKRRITSAAGLVDWWSGSAIPVILAWSPRGDRIAWVAAGSGRWGLYTVHADGSGKHLLAEFSQARVSPPEWSAGGLAIAVESGACIPED